MENSKAVCLSMFVPPYSDAEFPSQMYTDIEAMLGDEAEQHEYFTFMFTLRDACKVEDLERRLTTKGLHVSSNPCTGQYRGVKKLCTLSKQQILGLNLSDLNKAFRAPVIPATNIDTPKVTEYSMRVVKYSREGLKNFTVNELLRHMYVTFRVRINMEQYRYFAGLMSNFKPTEYALTAMLNDPTDIQVMSDVYITTSLQNWGSILSQNHAREYALGNTGLTNVFKSIQERIDSYFPPTTVPIKGEVEEEL